MFDIGMIHGRFQPFHIGHFEYFKMALDCSRKIIVGVTNPDPDVTAKHSTDSHRHKESSNPYPYFLRQRMIYKSIEIDNETVGRLKDVTIVPFPINKPELWEHYFPQKGVTQIMSVIEPWDEAKKELFESKQFPVHVISTNRLQFEDGSVISGTRVRDQIHCEKAYNDLVPAGTKLVLDNWFEKKLTHIF